MFVFFVFRKSCFIESCLSFKDLSALKMSWSHVDWCYFCINLKSLKISLLLYSKAPSKEMVIQIKYVARSVILIVPNFICVSAMAGELSP
jgi:hypothetical protein